MVRTRTAAAFLACGLLMALAAPRAPAREPAEPAPLASHGLLLGAARAGARLVCVGERGHILYSDDRGTTWRQASVPTQATLTAVHFPTPRNGWAVGHDSTILRSKDGGETWTLQFDDPESNRPLLDVWFADDERGYAVGAYGQYLVTANGGASWAAKRVSDEDVHFNAMAVDPDSGAMYIAGEAGALYVSRDAGLNWEHLDAPYDGSLFGILAAPGGRLFAFGLRGHLLRSDDGGVSFTAIATGSEATLMGATLMDDGTLAVVGLSGTVLTGRADGEQFDRHVRPDRIGNAAVAQAGPGRLLLFGEAGVLQEQLATTPRSTP